MYKLMMLGAMLVLAIGCSKSSSSGPTTPQEPAPATTPTPAETAPTPDARAGAPLTDAEIDELGTKALALIAELTRVANAAGGDCTKMATDMRAVFDGNRDLIKRLDSIDEEAQQRFDAKFAAEGEKAAEAMVQAVGTCQNDPALQKVFSDQG